MFYGLWLSKYPYGCIRYFVIFLLFFTTFVINIIFFFKIRIIIIIRLSIQLNNFNYIDLIDNKYSINFFIYVSNIGYIYKELVWIVWVTHHCMVVIGELIIGNILVCIMYFI